MKKDFLDITQGLVAKASSNLQDQVTVAWYAQGSKEEITDMDVFSKYDSRYLVDQVDQWCLENKLTLWSY